ncbi:MAG: sporulation membrane protein YtaF [Oscillospiraceae bacterium]|nr:sporulation membrane protein YtaF [Oscillospiraceae bacterium]
MVWLILALEAAVIAASLSIDTFAAAFAYGCKKIKIPLPSVCVINLICTCVAGVSLLFGSLLAQYIPGWFATGISFAVLLLIGMAKLFDSMTKAIIRKHAQFDKEFELSLFNFKFIMRLYADPEAADVDVSESISPKEAAALAFSLSLDGLAVGFSAALIGISPLAVIIFSLAMGFIALLLGIWTGNKAADKLPFNISWIAGAVLIGLAVMKLV